MKRRYEILANKRQLKQKQLLTRLNAGLFLFSAGVCLSQLDAVSFKETEVRAQQRLSTSQFLNLIQDSAARIAGENDLYASVMIAQAALESGWGNSTLAQAPNHNLFGIKGTYEGNTVDLNTLEDDGSGNYYQINAGFRRYDNYAQSLEDYAALLTGNHDVNNWRYNFYSGARRSNTQSYHDATAHLTGRYATDTRYGSKLNQIIEMYNLTQFDTAVVTPVTPTPRPNEGSHTDVGIGQYVVKAGDSVYRIALNHGMSMERLIALNGISNYTIHPGQVLKVSQSSQPAAPTPINNRDEVQPIDHNEGNTSSNTYRVKAGDSLYAIARRHGISIDALLSSNGLSISSVIHPGQNLRIVSANIIETESKDESATILPEDEVVTPTPSNPLIGTYVVQRGDGLYGIARKHGISLSELLTMNGLTTQSVIHPGQTLQVTSTSSGQLPVNDSPEITPSPVQPEVETPSEVVDFNESTIVESSSIQYVVKSGDTLYSIAQRFGLDVYQVIAQNGGTIIHPGQVLVLN